MGKSKVKGRSYFLMVRNSKANFKMEKPGALESCSLIIKIITMEFGKMANLMVRENSTQVI